VRVGSFLLADADFPLREGGTVSRLHLSRDLVIALMAGLADKLPLAHATLAAFAAWTI
jgi:hypothetical protein